MTTRREALGLIGGAAAITVGASLLSSDVLANDGAPRVVRPLSTIDGPLERFAFGACLRYSDKADILTQVVAANPQLMVWLGDNIYADTADMEVMRAKYAVLDRNPRFRALSAACPQLATWDDHDFGEDNGGADYAPRATSQQRFLDFWKASADDPRRTQEGVYSATTVGPPGQRVQFILLDGRYHRSPLKIGRRRTSTMLGEIQWSWLEKQLETPAEIRFICSGIQVINTDYRRWERWNIFPHERERLLSLVRDKRLPGCLLLSGDLHHAELSRERRGFGYPAWELTMGGMDQREHGRWPNRRRVGKVYNKRGKFGFVRISWGSDPTVHLEIRDKLGTPVIEQKVRLSTLQPG